MRISLWYEAILWSSYDNNPTWYIFGHLTLIGRCFELKCRQLGWQGSQIVTRRYFTKDCLTQLGQQSWRRKRYYPLLMLLALELKVKWVNLLDIYWELGLCTGQRQPSKIACFTIRPNGSNLPGFGWLYLLSCLIRETARNLKSHLRRINNFPAFIQGL